MIGAGAFLIVRLSTRFRRSPVARRAFLSSLLGHAKILSEFLCGLLLRRTALCTRGLSRSVVECGHYGCDHVGDFGCGGELRYLGRRATEGNQKRTEGASREDGQKVKAPDCSQGLW